MKPIKKLSCKETTHIVCDARDRPMSAEQSAQLQAHLETCDACKSAAVQFADMFRHLDILFARNEDKSSSEP
ncbi:MAG TPA: zf-HC2 domain-containing protein [Herbaspirillum sp.]